MDYLSSKEKAKQLVDRFLSVYGYKGFAIEYALICVDEIVKAIAEYGEESMELQNMDSTFRYWNEVKEHINNQTN